MLFFLIADREDEPNMKVYKELVYAMVRTGILGFGGGPSIIPLIRHEAVLRYKWIDDDEFSEILALANALPGPIATKMAGYLGYRSKGVLGAIVAILAHILPTSLAIITSLSLIYSFKQSKIMSGMIAAVRPVITVMLALMAYEFIQKTYKGLGKIIGAIAGIAAFVLMSVIQLNSAWIVILFLLYGAFHLRLVAWVTSRRTPTDKQRGMPL
jgi:chromate transporter